MKLSAKILDLFSQKGLWPSFRVSGDGCKFEAGDRRGDGL
jgi:hypothetical protein